MRTLLVTLALGLALVAPHAVRVVPDVEIDRAALVMHGDVIEREGRAFSGWVVTRAGGAVVERAPVLEGRAEGWVERYYRDGSLRARGRYAHGHREGEQRTFWPDGSLQSVRRYEADRFEGEQLAWHRGGRLAERLHYAGGREEGTQQIWEADGRLRTHYTVVEGRRYGLVGRTDCTSPAR